MDHPTSDNFIITFVVQSLGVNVNDNPFALSVHVLQPFVEYVTAVFADGPAVSLILHVVLVAYILHTLLVKFVHVNIGGNGNVLSICIVVADTCVA